MIDDGMIGVQKILSQQIYSNLNLPRLSTMDFIYDANINFLPLFCYLVLVIKSLQTMLFLLEYKIIKNLY